MNVCRATSTYKRFRLLICEDSFRTDRATGIDILGKN